MYGTGLAKDAGPTGVETGAASIAGAISEFKQRHTVVSLDWVHKSCWRQVEVTGSKNAY